MESCLFNIQQTCMDTIELVVKNRRYQVRWQTIPKSKFRSKKVKKPEPLRSSLTAIKKKKRKLRNLFQIENPVAKIFQFLRVNNISPARTRLLRIRTIKQSTLYLSFVDLSKAFDLVNQSSLFTVLEKSGCPPFLLALIRAFHNDMHAEGVKQRCVFDPTLFGIYFSHVIKTTLSKIDSSTGISLLSRDDGNFFNLKRFKALTKTFCLITREL